MTVAAGKSLAYDRVGQCFLYISAKKPPSDADWEEYITWLKKNLKPGMIATSLVFERLTGPNAAQRKQLTEATADVKLRVAVVTPSQVARGIVTAMGWFKEGYKAFAPPEMDNAITFLDLRGAEPMQVRQALQKHVMALDV